MLYSCYFLHLIYFMMLSETLLCEMRHRIIKFIYFFIVYFLVQYFNVILFYLFIFINDYE